MGLARRSRVVDGGERPVCVHRLGVGSHHEVVSGVVGEGAGGPIVPGGYMVVTWWLHEVVSGVVGEGAGGSIVPLIKVDRGW